MRNKIILSKTVGNIHERSSTHSIHAIYCCVNVIMCKLRHKIAPIRQYIEKKKSTTTHNYVHSHFLASHIQTTTYRISTIIHETYNSLFIQRIHTNHTTKHQIRKSTNS